MRLATTAIIAIAQSACTGSPDSLDAHQRGGVADALSTALNTTAVYVQVSELGQQPAPDDVTGTRASFVVGGTLANPWDVGSPGAVTGSGGVVGLAAQLELTVVLADWRDELWHLRLDGELEVAELATYRAVGDLLPDDSTMHVTGDLALSGQLEGPHHVDLVVCRRDVWTAFIDGGPSRFGISGTIDGQAATAQYSGNDPSCEPR